MVGIYTPAFTPLLSRLKILNFSRGDIPPSPPVYSTFTPLLSRLKIAQILAIQHLKLKFSRGGGFSSGDVNVHIFSSGDVNAHSKVGKKIRAKIRGGGGEEN